MATLPTILIGDDAVELLGRLRPGQRVRIFINYVVVLPAMFDRRRQCGGNIPGS